ncbi:CIC11C00000000963 [Sungouiella intermedia]|uniref:CIC11C00000000963 n=1 Tax=Sungouiella intermedia TaxID=45354 RepID=A0A1L0BTM1_9ASCO|nr:CIC11C00000000963 [[Candida] intermedia]
MNIIAKVLSLRLYLACFLVVVVLLNVTAITFHKPSTTLIDSKQGLEQKLDYLFSDEYLNALKEDLESSRKEELLDEIKAELTKEYKDKFVEKLHVEFSAKSKDRYEKEFKQQLHDEINRHYTKKFHETRVKNYNLLEELRMKYFRDNEELLKSEAALSLLNKVLKDQPKDIQTDLKKKVADELKSEMSLKSWLGFVLTDIIKAHAPNMPRLTDKEMGDPIRGCHRVVNTVNYDRDFLSRVKFDSERMDDFKSLHSKLVKSLRRMDVPPADLFNGEGIVISGGGEYFAGALVAIVQLREAGSKLPIELILDTHEQYDKAVCNDLEKNFNARCVVIRDLISNEIWDQLKLSSFQLKILGLLVSSFDHIISLDADNMALLNPDLLLTSEQYLKTKFLLWPDLWQRTISPAYYEIAGIIPGEVTKRNRLANGDLFADYAKDPWDKVHFHDLDNIPDATSTETGQMVFSKREHFRSFILSLYYNVYGESHYWRMFYQGSPGSGDRDTFVPALHVFNEPYHIVEHATWLAGFREESGRFQETTIVQYEPTSTSKFADSWRSWLRSKGMDSRQMYDQDTGQARSQLEEFKNEMGEKLTVTPKVQFLHIHRPKLNPVFMTKPEGYFDCFKQRNLDLHGHYAEHFGETDWELRFNLIVQWVACKGINSDNWWKSVDRDQKKVCEEVTKYVEFLKLDTKDKSPQKFTSIKI